MDKVKQEGEVNTAKNKFTKEQKELLQSVFAANKKEKKVLLVGSEVFLLKDKNYAINHSLKNGRVKRDKVLDIIEVSRTEVE